MLTRIITALIALAAFVAVLLSPDTVFIGAVALIMAVMVYECMDSAKVSAKTAVAGAISSAAMIAACIYNVVSGKSEYIIPSLIFAIIIHCITVVAEHGKTDYTKIFASGFLNAYVILTMMCVALAKMNFGTANMMLLFVCAWMTDTGAYFTGRALGKHKLIPHVSPNKTVEGAIGGVVVCMISCFVYSMIIHSINGEALVSMHSVKLVVIGAAAAVMSQLGDLVASSIKRDTGVKDFGKIFPGHGGFMDRFDSVVFIAPIIYGLLYIL